MIIYIITGIIMILLIYIFIIYNKFIQANNRVKEAFSTMDVYLKKRWELIPNLVEAVKGYSNHEKTTLEEVTSLRNNNYDNMTQKQKLEINQKINNNLYNLVALAESYPELKASNNYKDLSEKLTKTEEDIANARKYYNGCVRLYNNTVEMFPNNIFAKIFNYKTKEMFAAKEEEKQNINVEL